MPPKENKRSTGADDGRVVLYLMKSVFIKGFPSKYVVIKYKTLITFKVINYFVINYYKN